MTVPETVRRKAISAGVGWWLEQLPALIAELSREWGLAVGDAYPDASEAFVAPARTESGEDAVLKLMVPRGDAAKHEITVLRLADGAGCARLLESDVERGALLLEKLGPMLHDFGLPQLERLGILTDLAQAVWRPVPAGVLPTGRDKALWLASFVASTWERLGRPCSRAAVDHAVECAERRALAHDLSRAVLVHGDIHEWNALQSGSGFKLVDPDGYVAEPEYDLGVFMREDPVELLADGPWERAHWLAERTGLNVDAIWEWGVVERVSTGLVLTTVGLEPLASQMLAAADAIAHA